MGRARQPGSFDLLAETRLRAALSSLVAVMARHGVTPSQLTISGCVLSLLAAALIVAGLWKTAAVIFIIAGLFDVLDGSLARSTRVATPSGALLDSVLDRVSDGAVFFALTLFYFGNDVRWPAIFAMLAWFGAFLTSYVRARGAALGTDIASGLVTRAHRVVILTLGLVLETWVTGSMPWILAALAALGLGTAVYRLVKGMNVLETPDDQ